MVHIKDTDFDPQRYLILNGKYFIFSLDHKWMVQWWVKLCVFWSYSLNMCTPSLSGNLHTIVAPNCPQHMKMKMLYSFLQWCEQSPEITAKMSSYNNSSFTNKTFLLRIDFEINHDFVHKHILGVPQWEAPITFRPKPSEASSSAEDLFCLQSFPTPGNNSALHQMLPTNPCYKSSSTSWLSSSSTINQPSLTHLATFAACYISAVVLHKPPPIF